MMNTITTLGEALVRAALLTASAAPSAPAPPVLRTVRSKTGLRMLGCDQSSRSLKARRTHTASAIDAAA